jgi:hypothetical protein
MTIGWRDRDALLFPPSQQSFFLGRWDFRNRQDLEAHLCQIREAEFVCGDLRYVDYSSVDEGPRSVIRTIADARLPDSRLGPVSRTGATDALQCGRLRSCLRSAIDIDQ